MRIGIVDYGMGNLGSVVNACTHLQLPARCISAPDELAACDAVIVPGQGAFGDCMRHLHQTGFDHALRDWIAADRPFLGICMGLQCLFEASEESPGVAGLGVLPGIVARFKAPGLKIPQMGWNQVRWHIESPLLDDLPQFPYFYFVHSYHAPATETAVGATCYGIDYVSAVARGRMLAVQFHPEKSQKNGLTLLRNFARLHTPKNNA